MRYQGQGYELRIPWRNSPALLDDFHASHQRRFGYNHIGKNVEAVTLRLRATLLQRANPVTNMGKKTAKPTTAQSSIYFGERPEKCRAFVRESLPFGFSATGPAVITEYTATTVVPSGWKFAVSKSGALLLERKTYDKRDRIGNL